MILSNIIKMKKILLALVFAFFSVLAGMTQDKGDFRLGLYGQAISFREHVLPQYGLVGEYFLSHNFSMNYRYGLGYNSNGEITGHINPSLLSIAYLASASADEFIWAFLIPEGFSYHAYPNEFIEISPYLNPLGSEINLYDKNPIVLSCAFGMNLHVKPVENMSFTPNIGAIVIYGKGEMVPTFGFSMNYNFND